MITNKLANLRKRLEREDAQWARIRQPDRSRPRCRAAARSPSRERTGRSGTTSNMRCDRAVVEGTSSTGRCRVPGHRGRDHRQGRRAWHQAQRGRHAALVGPAASEVRCCLALVACVIRSPAAAQRVHPQRQDSSDRMNTSPVAGRCGYPATSGRSPLTCRPPVLTKSPATRSPRPPLKPSKHGRNQPKKLSGSY